jgi:hypothetical protein
LFLDTPEKNRAWLKDNPENHNAEDAFKVLRSRFNARTGDYTLRNNIIKNPEVGKILMLRKPELQVFGVCAYKEHKD